MTPTGELPPVNGDRYVSIAGTAMGVRKDQIFPAKIGVNGAIAAVTDSVVEITVFTKARGPLTKTIKLGVNGKIVTDSSSCRMGNGTADRVRVEIQNLDPMAALADIINNLNLRQAYALGHIKGGHPAHVDIVATEKLNGADDKSIIARTQEFLVFDEGKLGFALFRRRL